MKDGTERVAMLGIPGIGKSRSLALGLWHLVSGQGRPEWIKEPEAIVFEAWEGGFVFVFTKNKDGRWKAQSLPIGKWDASDCEHLQNSNNWYLVDASDRHCTGSDRHCTGKLPAKTVKACSPNREHYSNFIKDGGECVYVEAWREQELQVAHGNLATEAGWRHTTHPFGFRKSLCKSHRSAGFRGERLCHRATCFKWSLGHHGDEAAEQTFHIPFWTGLLAKSLCAPPK
ncbi:unnamed protein product [Effrenium voratum]|uniref:Uncharacterized protein n=1 Tax=Effrenium voratum TaxID=2562239 RepID=A0AA36IZB2_9DINO|nr:unnamed protein product [Effrenium voratum]CAJ1456922.1 unnamed protein product [Effrenium voratum]